MIEKMLYFFKELGSLLLQCWRRLESLISNNRILSEVLLIASWCIVFVIGFAIIFYLIRKFNS